MTAPFKIALISNILLNILLSLILVGPLQLMNGAIGLSEVGILTDGQAWMIFSIEWLVLAILARYFASRYFPIKSDLHKFTIAFVILFPITGFMLTIALILVAMAFPI